MNEFDKNQDKGSQTDQQGEKPAFGQFDKDQEQGQTGQQQELGQQELGQKGEATGQPAQQEQGEIRKDEFADAGQQQGDSQFKGEKGQGEQNR